MYDEDGQLILQIGTSKKIFSTDILLQRHRAVFLTKPPFNNKEPLLDNFTALVFLSTLNNTSFHFSQRKKSEVTIAGQKFTNFIEISHKG